MSFSRSSQLRFLLLIYRSSFGVATLGEKMATGGSSAICAALSPSALARLKVVPLASFGRVFYVDDARRFFFVICLVFFLLIRMGL